MTLTKENAFPSALRIKKGFEFLKIKESSEKIVSGSFTVLYLENSLEHFRLGIIVSKKVSKKACERNRIKRVIRETFRTNKNLVAKKDFLVIARFKCCNAESGLLKQNLLKLLEQAFL